MYTGLTQYNFKDDAAIARASLIPWQDRALMLLDLDAFFASVEVLDNPSLKGLPLVVGGKASKRGVVATASYEARAYGIHSAMPMGQAERLCPKLVIMPPRMKRYQELSAAVMGILRDETPWIEQVSIDEAFCDISPRQLGDHPVSVAQRILTRIDALGLSASIGLGTTKSIAKIASNLHKPQGLCVVFPGREVQFLSPLPCKELSGIGPVAQNLLTKAGIHTLGELAGASDELLKRIFGCKAEEMRKRACAQVHDSIQTSRPVKSVSKECTFAEDVTSESEALFRLKILTEEVARRLREADLLCNACTLKLRSSSGKTKSFQLSLKKASNNELELFASAKALFCKSWDRLPLRLIGFGTQKLQSIHDASTYAQAYEEPFSLFMPEEEPQSQTYRAKSKEGFVQARDAIKKKFGESSLMYAHDLNAPHKESEG